MALSTAVVSARILRPHSSPWQSAQPTSGWLICYRVEAWMWLMFSCRQETLGDPVEGQTGEAAKTLKIARMERQLSVG